MEQELILKARAGDGAAFNGLVRLYDRRIYQAAYSILRNPDESKDMVQETFIRAYRHINNFDPDRPFYPWLYRIVKNLCLNRTTNKGYRTASLPEMEQASAMAGPEESLMREESAREVREAVERLPEKHREIIVLKHFQDCSYKEMSEILDVPEGTVMSRLYHARKALKEALLIGE
ncbi:MAG: sigma-70 family RNA polymerase sigma factor [Spirochaetales bacterium]|nr:sigma-70 family RNA polymerase sigma factor [Spirochaetales bacterium]